MESPATKSTGKPRPALFRALGITDPPAVIQVGERTFHRVEIYKHDSWAATALYQCGGEKIVCKFNRRQRVFLMPMGWLGRWLARRETRFYRTLDDLDCVPKCCAPIRVDGKIMAHAAGHAFVEGRPLKADDRLPTRFFDDLRANLRKIHARGIAYMDLHKRENIILGNDGRGHFVDFQVSFAVSPRSWLLPARWLLGMFQDGDNYHLAKHELRHSREGAADREKLLDQTRPAWIRVHRFFAQPLRALRRRLLVALGIRKGDGRAQSEHFTEDGLRAEPVVHAEVGRAA